MANEKNKKSGKVVKRALISILIPILIVMLVVGAFYAIIHGIVELIEGVITKLAEIKSGWDSFWSHPGTWISDGVAQVTNFFEKGFDGDFNPRSAGIEGLFKPTIITDTEDFEAIKNSIDAAQVNRNSAGLEDYMLKIMLLSYYRSIYLSDYNIYIQITDEEKETIEKMNDEEDLSSGKYGCPFEIIKR